VQRVVSPQDRRARCLTLTAQGEHQLGACRPVVESLQAAILGPLDPDEQRAFRLLASKALGLG
jgi:DNA-binding MarR family transcriptional regulator